MCRAVTDQADLLFRPVLPDPCRHVALLAVMPVLGDTADRDVELVKVDDFTGQGSRLVERARSFSIGRLYAASGAKKLSISTRLANRSSSV